MAIIIILGSVSTQDLRREPTDFFCPENDPNGVFPHEAFCDKFYECVAGEALLVTCEDGLAYDETRR